MLLQGKPWQWSKAHPLFQRHHSQQAKKQKQLSIPMQTIMDINYEICKYLQSGPRKQNQTNEERKSLSKLMRCLLLSTI